MLKIILLIVIVFVALMVFRAYKRSLAQMDRPKQETQPEDMVKCAHCRVNLPRSEAIYSGGDFFCTPEHQTLGKK